MAVTRKELREALAEWQRAEQDFGMAEPEFVEAAAYKLIATEKRYSALVRLAKKEGIVDEAS